jgi:hypothetical protein
MPKITQLYVYVIAVEDEDDEAVPMAKAMQDGEWVSTPMMGADYARVTNDGNGNADGYQSARSVAQGIAKKHGRPIKLVRSTGLEVVEVIEP